jgi:pimeloyl-ACP methyl ester carboxylesterase
MIMGKLTAIARDKYPQQLELPAETAVAPQSFSVPAACALSWAAQLAYESDRSDKFLNILQVWGWTSDVAVVKPVSSSLAFLKGTKMFLARSRDTVIVSFAGTEPDNPGNWKSNFDFLKTTTGQHSGFNAGVTAVWPDISGKIETAKSVYFCGHSLGAAMAALAAHRFVTERPDGTKRSPDETAACVSRVQGVYALGMPRVGDAAFAAEYNALLGSRTFRLIHGYDIVPKVPPFSLPFGYRHVGRPIVCESLGRFDGSTLAAAVTSENSTFWDRAKDLMKAVLVLGKPKGPPFPGEDPDVIIDLGKLPLSVRDHLPDRYLQALGMLLV